MKLVNVRLPEKIISKIDKQAREHGITRSEVIRNAITFYLEVVKRLSFLSEFKSKVPPSKLSYARRDDCSIIKFPNGMVLTVGYVSSGAIGPKKMDKVKVDGYFLGKFMSRVALMEVISTGSWPISITVTLSVEMKPTGFEILRGVKATMRDIDLSSEVLNVDSEENIPTDQTGIGITVIGMASEEELKIGVSQAGDLILAIGEPCYGEEVVEAEKYRRIADLKDVMELVKIKSVHEIVPVDTVGIATKARRIASSIGRQVSFYENVEFDLYKSAGPSTTVLITLDREELNSFIRRIRKPYAVIGEIT